MDEDFDRHRHSEDLLSWPQRTQLASPPPRYNGDHRPRAARPYYHEDRQQQQRPPYHPEYPVEYDVDRFDRHPRRTSQEESWQDRHRQQEHPVLDRRDRQLRPGPPVNSLDDHFEAMPTEQEHPQGNASPRLAPHLWQDSAFVPSQYNDQPRHSLEPEDEWSTGMLSAASNMAPCACTRGHKRFGIQPTVCRRAPGSYFSVVYIFY